MEDRGAGFATRAAALEAMSRLQVGRADGTHVEPNRMTVRRYLEQWIGTRRDLRPNTRRDYDPSIRLHVVPRIGELPLQAVTRLVVRNLYA